MKNQRIQELARKSELAELYDRYVAYCIQRSDDDILDFETVVGKFAELIVRECLADLEEVKVADYAHDEYDKGYDDGLTQAQETIKERFGIKR